MKLPLVWPSTNPTGALNQENSHLYGQAQTLLGHLPKETHTCMAMHKPYWGTYPRKLPLVWPSTNTTGALTQGNSHLSGQAQTLLGRVPKETPTCMAKHKPYWGAYPRKLPLVWPSTNPTGALTQGNSHLSGMEMISQLTVWVHSGLSASTTTAMLRQSIGISW